MPVSQKPRAEVVARAAQILKNKDLATKDDAWHFAARIMDDEKNAPNPNKTDPKSQIISNKVTDLLNERDLKR